MSNSMTRQHFRALADAIAGIDLEPETRETVARAIGGAVSQFNDRFDRSKFIDWSMGRQPVPVARRRISPRPQATGGHNAVRAVRMIRHEREVAATPTTGMDRIDPWPSA
jgi:hypothetical protein